MFCKASPGLAWVGLAWMEHGLARKRLKLGQLRPRQSVCIRISLPEYRDLVKLNQEHYGWHLVKKEKEEKKSQLLSYSFVGCA